MAGLLAAPPLKTSHCTNCRHRSKYGAVECSKFFTKGFVSTQTESHVHPQRYISRLWLSLGWRRPPLSSPGCSQHVSTLWFQKVCKCFSILGRCYPRGCAPFCKPNVRNEADDPITQHSSEMTTLSSKDLCPAHASSPRPSGRFQRGCPGRLWNCIVHRKPDSCYCLRWGPSCLKNGQWLVNRIWSECKANSVCICVCIRGCTPLFAVNTYRQKSGALILLHLQRHIWAISIVHMFLSCSIVKAKSTRRKCWKVRKRDLGNK